MLFAMDESASIFLLTNSHESRYFTWGACFIRFFSKKGSIQRGEKDSKDVIIHLEKAQISLKAEIQCLESKLVAERGSGGEMSLKGD